ncbi:hypothetical protein TNCV_1976491 [Trichonephila clavipes]|nr:hypothetical protein TNCV_1976491 [Trichonephila clavipes]
MCTAPIMADQDILEFVQSSKNIIDADSGDQNEMNNSAPVPSSSDMRNIMKSMSSYLDTHSNGEMNKKIGSIEQFIDNFVTTRRRCYVWGFEQRSEIATYKGTWYDLPKDF